MKRYSSRLFMLCFLLSGSTVLFGQSNVVVSGGQATGAGGKASYSVGQINTTSIKSNDVTVSQGVQQPYEFYIEVMPSYKNEYEIFATAYPNPTSGNLYLRIDDGNIKDLSYKVIDPDGRLIAEQKIVSAVTTIGLEGLSNAYYYLKVYKSIFVMKTFKIIKTK